MQTQIQDPTEEIIHFSLKKITKVKLIIKLLEVPKK